MITKKVNMKEKQISDMALRYATASIVSGEYCTITNEDWELFGWIATTYPDLRTKYNYLYLELKI